MATMLRQVIAVVLAVVVAGCGAGRGPGSSTRLRGVWHKVHKGDTVASVAAKYGASSDEVAELNDLSGDEALAARDEIFVPTRKGKSPGTGAKPAPPVAADATAPASTTASVPPSTTGPVAAEGRCDGKTHPCLAWPADGELVSLFGERDGAPHDGLDIAAAKGSPVRAAEQGDVLYSGDKLKGYGNLVIIRHAGGVITVYAHNDGNEVKEGDKVARGQVVARIGISGAAKIAHLHFEVRVSEQAMDPLSYLPSREKK
jgi:lipoprotein NlpD